MGLPRPNFTWEGESKQGKWQDLGSITQDVGRDQGCREQAEQLWKEIIQLIKAWSLGRHLRELMQIVQGSNGDLSSHSLSSFCHLDFMKELPPLSRLHLLLNLPEVWFLHTFDWNRCALWQSPTFLLLNSADMSQLLHCLNSPQHVTHC